MLDGYYLDSCGAIVQDSSPQVEYDYEYIHSRYDQYETTREMSQLRTDLVRYRIWPPVRSVLDFGCGNGDFLNVMADAGVHAYGMEKADYPFGPKIKIVSEPIRTDLFCCFDSMEHLENPRELIEKVTSPYVLISLPWCHQRVYGDSWFQSWKHRRPGEHLWHFDHLSLPKFMQQHGYETMYLGNPEDEIRRASGTDPNILTMIFRKEWRGRCA